MRTTDKQKITEAILYILSKTGEIGYYHIFKILYFANAFLLAKYGKKIIEDDFCALPDGPVPTKTYDCFKMADFCDKELETMLNQAVTHGYEDASYIIGQKREPNLNFLSKADVEALDKSISENATLSFARLREKSHGNEWKRAFSLDGLRRMSSTGIAKDAGASDAMVEYIREMDDIKAALQ